MDRCSNGKGLIARMTLRELKALRFNKTFPEYANATIPTIPGGVGAAGTSGGFT